MFMVVFEGEKLLNKIFILYMVFMLNDYCFFLLEGRREFWVCGYSKKIFFVYLIFMFFF